MNSLAKTYNTQNFTVLSISFEKANAEIRGKFAFFDEHVKQFVKEIHERKLGDAFVVSTCTEPKSILLLIIILRLQRCIARV